ncbi:MAG: hypothetical protein Q8L48_10000 [Archangium sp.]|nr:hypothetical protein [Archangium sp.]
MKTTSLLSRLGLGALLTSLFIACPKVPDPDPLEPAPAVSSFTASQSLVPVGTTVKLTWSVENATSVKIDELKLGSVSGVSGNSGEVDVAITDDSLFVLTARNARGVSDTAVVSVRVGAAAGDILFTALPDTIGAGESVTLAWSAPGATAVTLTATPGGAIDVMGQAASGSVTVTPAANTTYTLTAGVRSATTTVTVRPTLLSFSASSLSADAGSMITLSWSTANATRVQLTAPGRGTLVDEMDAMRVASGSFADTLPAQVDPGQLFAYEITVTGAGTTLTDSVIVSVAGNPAVVTFTAPPYARSVDGGVVSLAWTTREADQVSIAADGVEIYRAPTQALAAAGTLQVPTPPADVVYTLHARNSRGGEASASKTVDVVGIPTVTLTATPMSVAGGAPVTLSWSGEHIRNVAILEAGFGSVFGATGVQDTGTAIVLPNGDTTYTIEVDNTLGDRATATAMITVTNPVTLAVAETGALRVGQNVNVSWTLPGSTPSIVGLGHDGVDVRAASTGFDNIALTGTKLTFAATGNIVASIDTSFRTILFGRAVGEKITVTRNGTLTFGYANGQNTVDEALPSTKLEPLSIAPYWESLTLSGGVFWQVKTVAGVQTLIVQWVTSTANFQAKIAASGQIDFEYSALPTTAAGRVGITGVRKDQVVIGPAAVVGQGFTFFGPRPSPVLLRVQAQGPIAGHLDLGGGQLLRLSSNLATVVSPDELIINEALPASTVGVPGQWAELRNARDTALDLTGWTFSLADGGALALSGTVPARGLLVVGASTDPALNDDAGVQVAIANFDLSGETALTLNRGGPHGSLSLALADAGTALVNDLGPYRYNTGSGAGRCAATATFGGQSTPQKGTPGLDTGCSFPYVLASATPGYFDISDAGTPLVVSDFDDSIAAVNLGANPIPFFGTPRSSVQVSTNGFVTFDATLASDTNYISSTTPSTTDSNLVAAVFARDLIGNTLIPGAQIYSRRVGAGEDPFASAPHWIIQWHHFSYYTTSTVIRDDYNFQVKFFDDGVIEYHYDTMLSTSSSQYGSGIGTVTWLENAAGTQALTVNAQSSNPGISPRSAFRFVPR